jgi:hypothetical protein
VAPSFVYYEIAPALPLVAPLRPRLLQGPLQQGCSSARLGRDGHLSARARPPGPGRKPAALSTDRGSHSARRSACIFLLPEPHSARQQRAVRAAQPLLPTTTVSLWIDRAAQIEWRVVRRSPARSRWQSLGPGSYARGAPASAQAVARAPIALAGGTKPRAPEYSGRENAVSYPMIRAARPKDLPSSIPSFLSACRDFCPRAAAASAGCCT